MQISDLPDLAHTRPRPVHWLATATAMAAVVAAAGLLQPDAATANQPGSTTTARTTPNTAPPPAPDTTTVDFPLACGGAKALVTKEATGDLDGDGHPETVAAARCDAGSGTPPSGLYVLTATKDAGAPASSPPSWTPPTGRASPTWTYATASSRHGSSATQDRTYPAAAPTRTGA